MCIRDSLFFNNPPTPADDAPFLTKLAANLIEWTNWDSLPLGFVLLMCFITWANRMLNISTSGKWVTVALLFITFLPIIISLDNLISNIVNLFSSNDTTYNFIPIDNYNFFISGLLFLIAFWGFTYKYQRSFSYAVTTNAIISYQRTTRRVDHDPRHCFYKIRKWDDIKMMLNEMHRKHSQSNMLEDIKSALTNDAEAEA